MPLPDSCDVAVIGGGLVGTALCYELACKGVDVVMIDRHHEGRATDAGAGILSPETFLDPDDEWAELARAAGAYHHRLTEQLENDGVAGGTGRTQCGLLRISTSESEEEWLEELGRLADRRTPGLLERVGPHEVSHYFPPIGNVRGALFNPDAARIDGRLANEAIGKAADAHGARRINAEVISLESSHDRVNAMMTTEGKLSAGSIAIAGGAWTANFESHLHVELPISPLKGQIVHLSLHGAETENWAVIQPMLSHYLVPWPGGRVACGGTLEAQAGFDAAPTAGGLFELLREGLKTAPGLSTSSVIEVRVGLRPASSDGRPILGRMTGWSNVHVATGHGTEGLLMGPYSAALVAEGIVAGTDPEEIASLSAQRFQR